MDPNEPPERTTTHARVEALLGGRFVRVDYQGTIMGAPHAGQMLFGFHREEGLHTLAWIDSFHTGTTIMMSTGAPVGVGVDVLGSYAAGPDRWGWRTWARREGDTLVLEAFNIAPSGESFPAVRSVLRRA
jgi:hypothetical protein